MKKLYEFLVLTGIVLFLAACSDSESNSRAKTSEDFQVRLIVKTGSDKTDEKVSFKKGDTVMDVLKANYKVKEKGGFITAIDGLSQDKKTGRYWMFDVNNKLASKSADKIKVKDGDKIEFYQKVYKDKK
ncbi:DUF4430 domain-containing protein [Streptococcus devriesei]|uniref:DUF4430 domain-containing protein n=1 Tax=Streptococcus devriesei TaxID=231233 RepID=UPI000403001A|nr:DUF4430 domain-containing protein [Streptococcus devriesei]